MKLKVSFRELPGGPEVETQGFHCSKPGEGTKILKAAKVLLKINKLKKKKDSLRNSAPASCNQEVGDRRKRSRRK